MRLPEVVDEDEDDGLCSGLGGGESKLGPGLLGPGLARRSSPAALPAREPGAEPGADPPADQA